jgi:1,4-dihydroxy-2-naphthoyl-CoA hydrolase
MVVGVSEVSHAQVPRDGFNSLCGFEVIALSEREARGRLASRKELADADGALHGGVLAALAQSLARLATAAALPAGQAAQTLSNQTSFLRPIARGCAHARASRKHRGRRTWVWEVECSDEAGALCALSRVTVAVAEQQASSSGRG